MEKFVSLFIAVILISNFNYAQECIDETLIDPYGICITIYDPVCGCNGITYSNSCVGQTQAGITSWTYGVCPPSCINPSLITSDAPCYTVYSPVCGCDGHTYYNSCFAQNTGGVTSWTTGPCPNVCLPINYIFGNVNTGTYESSTLTHSDGNINAGKNVVYESQTEVLLESDFDCEANADFLAEIDACNNTAFSLGISNPMGISQTFTKYKAGFSELQLLESTNLCPNNAVEVEILLDGSSIYYEIIEILQLNGEITAPLLKTVFIPESGIITLNINLVNSQYNQDINCITLGDANFIFGF